MWITLIKNVRSGSVAEAPAEIVHVPGSVVDVPGILQQFQQFLDLEMPQIQFIDRILACSCTDREIPQVLFVMDVLMPRMPSMVIVCAGGLIEFDGVLLPGDSAHVCTISPWGSDSARAVFRLRAFFGLRPVGR